ncbi:response regulator [Dongia deserti]|uniref:response regulator n=1 Tax=Dongia deserti TaxID=2268030 RepID=UPI000E648D0D|nr:response regulator [Dongia deserti]
MDRSPHILVVDDDREIRSLLSKFLTKNGLRVSVAADGREMRRMLDESKIDLIVLDVMLPGDSGLTLCGQLRATTTIPILMLTAVSEDTDRIIGLEMGADDYLPKPFNPRELLARIRAILRRADDRAPAVVGVEAEAEVTLAFDGWAISPGRRQLLDPAGQPVDLTGGEFDLLLALVERPQRVLSRDRLLDLTKGRAASLFDRSIDVQIGRLRRKLENAAPGSGALIATVRGGGYMFTAGVTRSDTARSGSAKPAAKG